MIELQDPVLSDIKKKIERERNIAFGAANLKKKTNNAAVIQKCNTSIREAQQNIEYLEETLSKLTLQKESENRENSQQRRIQQDPLNHEKSYDNRLTSPNSHELRSPTPVALKPVTFTRLELMKYDCPSLGHRIQSMLQQLEFRIQVEQQYLEANEKISKLYQMDGDRQSTNKAESGRIESGQKILLLKKALKRYQAMHVDIVEVTKDTEVMNTPTLRKKTLSGTLNIGLTTIRDVDHIASPTFSRKPESFISLKIDGIEVARTKGSRNDRWNEEFNIKVDKGNELEITVYDKSGSQYIPVAVTWFLISDITEEIRKKKLDLESNSAGWISASKLQLVTLPGGENRFLPESPNKISKFDQLDDSTPSSSGTSNEPIVSNAWYILEPSGQILVTLGFTKSETSNKKDFIGGLGRHGAIRQRKQEVYEQHGHKFVQKQFYNVMSCALCGDFLRYTGYQCQDCKLLCHKKCYQKIVTKCISKSSSEIDPDEAKLNHRIPHRFEPVSNRGTKWCCHCGYILPWSRKTVRKCTECGIMCHSHCIHLVPDFCGMSLEMANKILTTIKTTKGTNPRLEAPRPDPQSLASSSTLVSKFQSQQAQLHHQTMDPYLQTMDPYRQSKELPSIPDSSKIYTPVDSGFPNEELEKPDISPYSKTFENDEAEDSYMDTSHISEPAAQQKQNTYHDPATQIDGYRTSPYHQQQQQHQQQQFELQKQQEPKPQSYLRDDNPFGLDNYHSKENQVPQVFSEEKVPVQEQQKVTQPPKNIQIPLVEQQQQLQPQPQQQQSKVAHHHHHHQHKPPHRRRRKLGLDDFQFLAVLGAGNFGKVMLAESRHTSKLCAIKVLKKDFIIESDEIASTRSEKRVFLIANKERHPFLLNLHCCFQTENRVYFVMEYISGGDLMHHVQCERFTEDRAQFYAAEILLGLKYLHDNGVIYRDLKLDNILLTIDGHIKLADYGLCKEGMWHGKSTSTFCGTPEFMAPEILNEQGYGRAVDWWAFGVLLYQMLCNRSPFNGEDEDDTFSSIQNDEARYPVTMTRDAVYLLQGLLTKDPLLRLGGSERDALEIMEHSYFANVNFDDILNLRVTPPFVPEIRSARDLSNFDSEFTSETPRLTPVNSILDASQQEQFRGFSYTSGDEVV